MIEPTRPDPERLSEALHCAATLDLPVAKILVEELRWQEWADLQQLKIHIQTIDRQAGKLERYVDTVVACLQAAGASSDIDVMEAQVSEAGTKPSHFIAQQMDELRQSNAAMARQLKDQDLRAERQHREWDEKMRNLQDEFDALQGKKEASDGNVTSLKAKLERIEAAIKNFDELMKK